MIIFVMILMASCKNKETQQVPVLDMAKSDYYLEPYRPQYHFSPEEKWMNDPNGVVFHKGVSSG